MEVCFLREPVSVRSARLHDRVFCRKRLMCFVSQGIYCGFCV